MNKKDFFKGSSTIYTDSHGRTPADQIKAEYEYRIKHGDPGLKKARIDMKEVEEFAGEVDKATVNGRIDKFHLAKIIKKMKFDGGLVDSREADVLGEELNEK